MKFELYKDSKKEFRWRLRAKNGKYIADSAESYKSKRSAMNMILKIARGNLPRLTVIEDLTNKERIVV